LIDEHLLFVFTVKLCESDALFPVYFGEDLFNVLLRYRGPRNGFMLF